jgi:small subunit ribosomal protein S20
MPIIKSAKKRVRIAAKAATRNSKTKRDLREAIKDFHTALASGKADKIAAAQQLAVSAIDIATKKNVIHKNKAARKKHQLAVAINKAGVKPVAAKKTAVKAVKPVAAKKAPVKKTPAKKPVAKTVKKAATKKTAAK